MQKVTFLQPSISHKDEKGEATKDSKYYAMVRVVSMVKDEATGFEFASQEFNAVILSTKETVEKLEAAGKGFELPFQVKPRTMVDTLTGEVIYDCVSGDQGMTSIVKADIVAPSK